MPRPALVLMLELEALWISAAGTLLAWVPVPRSG